MNLTSRQLEILQLTADGYTVQAICATLQISECTVVKHKQRIMDRLGADNSCHMVALALRRHLIQ